ncbi:hypothetical protein ABZ070_02245 [Streptomyces sp. NPDC006283]|uniref:DUF6907 domain-containing protein n=1 Tax=Streptomyces sp. NPDC006283 TaxID=3156741 RepID=UPI0033BC1A90
MTSHAAIVAAETTTAPGGNPTPSVEQSESAYQQIGSSMPILADASNARQANSGQSLDAAKRGPEWMARFGCPVWCVMDHAGTDGEPGWHQGLPAEAIAPTPFCDADPGGDSAVVLAARVTQVNQDPKVFGVETRLWVDVDCETLELDVAQTDVFIARLETFLPQLRALRAQLAEASKDDVPENTEAKAAWLAAPAKAVAK